MHGRVHTDLGVQMSFLHHELTGSAYVNTGTNLAKAAMVESAVDTFAPYCQSLTLDRARMIEVAKSLMEST
jgi:hypothetical protein